MGLNFFNKYSLDSSLCVSPQVDVIHDAPCFLQALTTQWQSYGIDVHLKSLSILLPQSGKAVATAVACQCKWPRNGTLPAAERTGR